jgi:hypothetical protein
MERRALSLLALVAFGLAFLSPQLFGEDKDSPKDNPSEGKEKKERKEKPPRAGKKEEKLDPAMEAMLKAGAPNENHKALEPLAGEWTTAVKFWMAPGAPPQESAGTCKRKWILDGRFLEELVTGKFFGMPYHGRGLSGYDNLKKQYNSVYVDSMSTGIFTMLGTLDKSGKTFTYTGEYDDPMTGKPKKTRWVIRIESNDKHTIEFYEPAPPAPGGAQGGEAGKEFKTMEIVFTRK